MSSTLSSSVVRVPIRLLLFGLLLSPAATNRAQASDVGAQQVNTIAWPTDPFGSPGTFTRMVAGDISGDGIPDAVGLAGNQVVFFEDVAVHTALTLVPRVANDIDLTPGPNASLALVNETGLEILYLTHPAPPDTPIFVASSVVEGAWAGALKVRCADIDGTGGMDYVGVAADGRTLLGLCNGVQITPVTLLRSVLGIELLRWTQNDPLRIAVLTSTGVTIYDQSWSPVEPTFSAGSVPGGVIAVLKGAGSDKLAWVREISAGQQAVVKLAAGGSITPWMSVPGSAHVVAATAGDIDADGTQDLVLSHQASCLPLVCNGLAALTDSPTPLLSSSPLGAMSGSSNRATPLVADLDLDGVVDVIVAAQPDSSYTLVLHDLFPPSLLMPGFYQQHSAYHLTADALSRVLRIVFAFPSFPDSFTPTPYVELVVWRQSGGPNGIMDGPVSFDHRLYIPLQPMTGVLTACQETYARDESDAGGCFSWIYWFEMRATKVVNGQYTALGPTYVAALVPQLDWISQMSSNGEPLIYLTATPVCSPSSLGPGGDQRAPAIVGKQRLPKFLPNVVPTPKPIPSSQNPGTLIPDPYDEPFPD